MPMTLAVSLVLVLVIAIPLCVRQVFAMRDHLRSLPPVKRPVDFWRSLK